MENGKPTDTEERFLELLQVSSHTTFKMKDSPCNIGKLFSSSLCPEWSENRKVKLLYFQPLAESASKIYPGWRMRIFHNITEDDQMVRNSHSHHWLNLNSQTLIRPSPPFAKFTASTSLSTCAMCAIFQSLEISTPSSLLGDSGDSRFGSWCSWFQL